jgi:2-oxoglutarate ferredoxin oxidoreductase subunit gamma
MKKEITKIVLAGEGGQGIQTIAKILSAALVSAGYFVSYIPQFGPEQRGTPSVSFIQFSKSEITYPKFDTADIVMVLRRRAIKTVESFIGAKTQVLFDSSTIARQKFTINNSKIFAIPATKLAEEQFGNKNQNILALGVLAKFFLDYPKNAMWEIISDQLGKKFAKNKELAEKAKAAFDFAYNFPLESKKFSKPEYDTSEEIIIKKNLERVVVIIPKYCKGCGICIEKCPVKALSFGKTLGVYGTPTPEIDIEKCIACGNCFRFCPDSAIKVEKK